ncbi:hypothetical protein F5884DRAFT_901264 [Xylogone sp. PMI_703]|nr:hypothetical protein F5884DRAFT_901264 [Xylogone sp. PMI_703]
MPPPTIEFDFGGVADPAAGFTPVNRVDIPEDVGSEGSSMTDLSHLSLDNKAPVTPKKGKKAVKKEEADDDHLATPTPKARKTPKGKAAGKAKVKAEDDDAAGPPTPASEGAATSGKRRGSKAVDGETPTKKARNAKEKFPQSQAEFSAGDRLIIFMRKDGKPWPEIEEAWSQVTSTKPGKDVIRKRHAKLLTVAQEWKAGDAQKLTVAKQQFEKKMEREKWAEIAKIMVANGADEYKPTAVEKKWETLVKQKLVDDAGNYVGDDASNSEEGGDGSDANVKEDPEDADEAED